MILCLFCFCSVFFVVRFLVSFFVRVLNNNVCVHIIDNEYIDDDIDLIDIDIDIDVDVDIDEDEDVDDLDI